MATSAVKQRVPVPPPRAPPAVAQPSWGSRTVPGMAGVLAAELGSVPAMSSSTSVVPSPSLSTPSVRTRSSAPSSVSWPVMPRARMAQANGVTNVSAPVLAS
jgi:hypothetical protein